MNVLSLFDGMSCGQIALERAEVDVNNYYSSQIDKYTIAVTQHHYPDTIQLGDVNNMDDWDLPKIDLIMGGFPCQGFSFAGNRLNFDDPRSQLFFKCVKALELFKPKYFLFENVKMKKEFQDIISQHLGVEPVEINSSLFSAQNRKRLYWTNIGIKNQFPNSDRVIADILGQSIVNERVDKIITTKSDVEVRVRKHYINKKELSTFLRKYRNKTIDEISEYCKVSKITAQCWFRDDKYFSIPNAEHWGILKECLNIEDSKFDKYVTQFVTKLSAYHMHRRIYHIDGKHPTLTTITGGGQRKTITDGNQLFYLSPIHCERLQTIPDDYTLVPFGNRMMSDTQRYKMIGNGWTVDVIAHIFKNIKEDKK